MDELRLKLLTLLKEIDYICKKYDITYYAEGGTIIGALRHNGFIPWDDDMDIVMTRDNFNKFIDAYKKENIPNRVLECPDLNKKYPLVTIKYTDTESTTIFRSLFLDVCQNGVYIDIFILDPIPKGKEKWFKKNFLSYTEILNPFYVINNESSSFRYFIDTIKCKIFGKDKVLNNYRKKLFCYNEEDCEEFLIRWGITYQTVPKEYYGVPRMTKFEDILMPVPCKGERILTNYFGDDWYIVPEEQNQLTHNVVQNLNVSNHYYKKDYLRYIDKKKLMGKFLTLKKLTMKKKHLEVYNLKHLNILNSYKENIDINLKIKKEKVEKLFIEKKYSELDKYTNIYFQYQDCSFYRNNNIFINLDLKTIYYILFNSILIGKFYNASSVLKMFKDNDEFKMLCDLIEKIRHAKFLYYEKEYEKSLEIVNELLKENKNNNSAYKIKLDIMLENNFDNLKYNKFIKEIEKYYKVTNDVELLKYIGDIYLKLDDKKKAFEYYNKVIASSRNGLLLLDIKKKMA